MYEKELLQLSRETRFRRPEAGPDPLSERRNPACGDEVTLYANMDQDRIQDLEFYAQGCAVCIASCSALCRELNGITPEQARTKIEQALGFFDSEDEWKQDWGIPALPALGAVRTRPMRMTCVKLAWLALKDVI